MLEFSIMDRKALLKILGDFLNKAGERTMYRVFFYFLCRLLNKNCMNTGNKMLQNLER